MSQVYAKMHPRSAVLPVSTEGFQQAGGGVCCDVRQGCSDPWRCALGCALGGQRQLGELDERFRGHLPPRLQVRRRGAYRRSRGIALGRLLWATLCIPAAHSSRRVHYGLWPSDSPEQLRCDGGGEMLRNQIDVLSARLTRKLLVCRILQKTRKG